MSQIADSMETGGLAPDVDGALELRVFRVMIATAIVAVIFSAMLAPWRVTLGLMLGGSLSLLNFHWLRTSVVAIFNVNIATQQPRVKISRYIIRYFVIGAVAFASYKLQMVSLPATIAGLCSFVPALFVEAFRQFYFAIIHREESF